MNCFTLHSSSTPHAGVPGLRQGSVAWVSGPGGRRRQPRPFSSTERRHLPAAGRDRRGGTQSVEGRNSTPDTFEAFWASNNQDWEDGGDDCYDDDDDERSGPLVRRWISTEEIVEEQAKVVSHVLKGEWDEELLGTVHIQSLNWAIKTLGQRRRVDLSARLFAWLHGCGRATAHTFSKYVEACALAGRPALAQAAWSRVSRSDPWLLGRAYALSHLVRAHCEAGDVASGEAALAEAYAAERGHVTHYAVSYVMEAGLRLGRPKTTLKAFHDFRRWLQAQRGRNYVLNRTGLDGEEYDEAMGGVWAHGGAAARAAKAAAAAARAERAAARAAAGSGDESDATAQIDTADADTSTNGGDWKASPTYNGADLSGAWADKQFQGWYWLGEDDTAAGAPFPPGGPRRLPGMSGSTYVLALQALQAAGGWHLTPALCRCMDQDGIRPSQQMCTLIFRLLGQAGLVEEALGFLKFLYPKVDDTEGVPPGKEDRTDVIHRNALLRGYAESAGPGEFSALLGRLERECGHVLDSWTLGSQLRCATRLGEGMPAVRTALAAARRANVPLNAHTATSVLACAQYGWPQDADGRARRGGAGAAPFAGAAAPPPLPHPLHISRNAQGGHPTLAPGAARRFVRRVGEATFARVMTTLGDDTRAAASPCNALMSLYLALGEHREALRVLQRMEANPDWPAPDVVSLRKAREAAIRLGDARLISKVESRLQREETALAARSHGAGPD